MKLNTTNANKYLLHISMVKRYNEKSATHHYIFGFVEGENVYACKVENAELLIEGLTYIDSASKGQGASLRYRPNGKQKEVIKVTSSETKILGTVAFLETLVKETGKNRGQIFEEMTIKAFNGKGHKGSNNANNFTACGDMTLDGKEYQIKFSNGNSGATFTNERTLKELEG